jgi:hypothetical protein
VEYPLISITFYNREDFNWYADGMSIGVQDGKMGVYDFKIPLRLTGQMVQRFAVSADDVIVPSPYFQADMGEGQSQYSDFLGYGISSITTANQICSARGQRVCRKDELLLLDVCAAGFVADGTTGFPMAHGGKYGCGTGNPSKPNFSPWVGWGSLPAGVYCCDKDHIGAYPSTTEVAIKPGKPGSVQQVAAPWGWSNIS